MLAGQVAARDLAKPGATQMTLDLVLGAVEGDLAQPPVKRGAVGQTTRGCLLSNDQENPTSGQHTVKPCRCGQRSPDRNARGAQRVRVRRSGISPTRRTPSEGHDGGPVSRGSLWRVDPGRFRSGVVVAVPALGPSASDGAIRARSRVPPAPDGAVRKLSSSRTRAGWATVRAQSHVRRPGSPLAINVRARDGVREFWDDRSMVWHFSAHSAGRPES